MRLFPVSVNHMLASLPAAIPPSPWFDVGGKANSVMIPTGVMRPIALPLYSVNHILPSGPAAIHSGLLKGVDTVNNVLLPVGVIRPIRLFPVSVNQRLLSGPAAMLRR